MYKYHLVIVAMLLGNLALCFFFIKIKNEFKVQSVELEAKSFDHCKDEVSDGFLNTLKYGQEYLHVSDNARAAISSLFDNANEANKLFYRLDFPFCGTCIYHTIDKITEHKTLADNIDIVIIPSFPSEEYSEDFNRFVNNKNLKVLNIPDLEFYLDNKNSLGSYLFTMDSKFRYRDLFFLNNCNQFMINKYLDYINKI